MLAIHEATPADADAIASIYAPRARHGDFVRGRPPNAEEWPGACAL
jgi:hypothetical protein